MQALRFVDHQLKLENIDRPHREGEALVRVVKSGICNTDLEIVRGYAGFSGTIGHEFVGVVESAPSRPELVGVRVVGEINAGCGRCALCRRGDPRHCPERTVLGIHCRDGAHAEFLTLPPENLLAVPDAVSDEEAVFAEPLAAAYGITEQLDLAPETRVAVVGDGKLGLLCAFALALKGARLVLVGKHLEKLALAEKRGIETVAAGDALPALARRFGAVVEASGSTSGLATALELVEPRGRLVLKSTFQGPTSVEMWRVVVDEISIVGSRCGRFAPALALLAERRVAVKDLIAEEFPLARGVAAMKCAATRGALKVLLAMNE